MRALMKSWFCCSLITGSFIIAVYTMVVYLIAFAVELWWIIEANGSLPAPAYILCIGYFATVIMSVSLIYGLMTRRVRYLMSWLFVLVLFYFPEMGMVLFMSLYYWGTSSNYGVAELTYWICRALFNILGIIGIQAQYAMWKEENNVLKRLQDLTLQVSTVSDGVVSNGHHAKSNGTLGYQNAGFVGSVPTVANGRPSTSSSRLSTTNKSSSTSDYSNGVGNGRPNRVLKRSLSAAAAFCSPHSRSTALHRDSLMGGSLPAPNVIDTHLVPLNTLQLDLGSFRDSQSQFDASSYASGLVKQQYLTEMGIAGIGLVDSHDGLNNVHVFRPVRYHLHRRHDHQILNQQQRQSEFWNRGPPSRPVSLSYVDQVPFDGPYATQSLDRRKYMRGKSASVEALSQLRPTADVILQPLRHEPFSYLANSKSSLGDDSDSRYRDVAL